MYRCFLLPGEVVDRCYTKLMVFSFIGAFIGVLFFPLFITADAFQIAFSNSTYGNYLLDCLFPYSIILLSSLTAYGYFLIPLVFSGKAFIASVVFDAVLQSESFSKLYALLIYELPSLFSFFLIGGFLGAFAWNNARLIKNGQAAFSVQVFRDSVPFKALPVIFVSVLVPFMESLFKFFLRL